MRVSWYVYFAGSMRYCGADHFVAPGARRWMYAVPFSATPAACWSSALTRRMIVPSARPVVGWPEYAWGTPVKASERTDCQVVPPSVERMIRLVIDTPVHSALPTNVVLFGAPVTSTKLV